MNVQIKLGENISYEKADMDRDRNIIILLYTLHTTHHIEITEKYLL